MDPFEQVRDCTKQLSPRSDCGLGANCIPIGLSQADVCEPHLMVCAHRHVKRGDTLYRFGDRLGSIYPIRAGLFKVYATTERGDLQVTGFYMGGEIMGLDAVATQRHTSTATAIEDSEVCIVPFAKFEKLCMKTPTLQQHFRKVMAKEIAREQSMMLLLGSMNAEERVGSFLLNLSARLFARGYASSDFNLRMSREDIGNYLGLKLETVSRTLSGLQRQGLLDVHGKQLRILDIPGLERVVGKTQSTA
jgi:CRP/FNR family transcriptional regulator, anaerobic regulatory protein